MLEESKEKIPVQFFGAYHFKAPVRRLAVIEREVAENSDQGDTEYKTFSYKLNKFVKELLKLEHR